MGRKLRAQLSKNYAEEERQPMAKGAALFWEKFSDNRLVYREAGIMERGAVIGTSCCAAKYTADKCDGVMEQKLGVRTKLYCSTKCRTRLQKLFQKHGYKVPVLFNGGKQVIQWKGPDEDWFREYTCLARNCKLCDDVFMVDSPTSKMFFCPKEECQEYREEEYRDNLTKARAAKATKPKTLPPIPTKITMDDMLRSLDQPKVSEQPKSVPKTAPGIKPGKDAVVFDTDPTFEVTREQNISMIDAVMPIYRRKLEAEVEMKMIVARRLLENHANGDMDHQQVLAVLELDGQTEGDEGTSEVLQSTLRRQVSVQAD